MKAIILAGGQGTRLRPLTLSRHKSLMPVLNRPLMDHVLDWLAAHGVDEAILAMGPENEDLGEAYPPGARRQLAISHSMEEEPLGSGGAIRLAAGAFKSTFLVLNGDVFTDMDLGAMHSAHRRHQAAVSINLTTVEEPSQYGVAVRGADGFVERFVEKPPPGTAPSRLINAGAWLFEPAALELVPPGPGRLEDTLFPALAKAGRLYGHVFDGLWADIGTPERYLRLNLALLERGKGNAGEAGHIAAAVLVEKSASLRRSVIGERCVVGNEACIDSSVLWEDVHVGAGSEVAGSLIASGAVVGEGARVKGALVAGGAVVAPGATLEPGDIAMADQPS